MKFHSEQAIYIVGGIFVAPFVPLLYWQGQQTRKNVGRLPDAAGETVGTFGQGNNVLNMLVIGESTVAGVGAENHGEALAGQLAKYLSLETGKSVRWNVVGESGITARETLEKLVPVSPNEEMDLIVVGLGGNDTFKVHSPNRFARDMKELIETLRDKYPGAQILLTNTPMVIDFTALPQPLKFVLWRVSRLHHAAIRRVASRMKKVFYFDEPERVGADFFSDGIHPSPLGYALWSEAMIKFLLKRIEV